MKQNYSFIKLFMLTFMALFAGNVMATTVTKTIEDIAKTNSWENATQYLSFSLDANVTVTATGGGNTGKYYTNGNQWRIYENESPTVTITVGSGYSLSAVTIKYASQNTGTLTKGSDNIATDTEVTASGSSIEFGVGNTGSVNNGQVRITEISVTYGSGGSSVTVPAPTISGNETFSGSTQVTITGGTGVDAIYYTTDGTDPKSSATKKTYSDPITISETTTIKAVAEDGDGNLSSVVSKTFTKSYTCSNIADVKKLSAKEAFNLTLTNAQVLYVNGTADMFIQDATGAIDLFASGLSYKAGDILNGTLEGTYEPYNNMPEIKNVKNAEITSATGTVTPTPMTVAEALDAANACKLAKFENVTISKDGDNYYIVDGSNSLQLYDKYGTGFAATLTDLSKKYTITAMVIPFYKDGADKLIEALPIENFTGTVVNKDYTVATLQELTDDIKGINLTISNNAKVVYIDGNNVFVRDGENAVMFYSAAALKEKVGINSKISGTITADYDNYYGIHEIKLTDDSNLDALTITPDENTELDPITVTVDDLLALKHVCDLVKIEGVTASMETVGSTNTYYAKKDGKQFIVTNTPKNFSDTAKGEEGTTATDEFTIVGVFNTIKSNVPSIKCDKTNTINTGINDIKAEANNVNAPAFNVAGQRVKNGFKGIVIQNGKKIVK